MKNKYRVDRPGWFAAGAGAVALAVLLATDLLPSRDSGAEEPAPTPEVQAVNTPDGDPAIPALSADSYEASLAAGRNIVDRAIQAGKWTHEDAAAFGTATARLEQADRLLLQQQLVAAVSTDQAPPQDDPPTGP